MTATTAVTKPGCWESFQTKMAPCKEWTIKIGKIAFAALVAFGAGWLAFTLLPVGWSAIVAPVAALIVAQLACDYLGLRPAPVAVVTQPVPNTPVVPLPPGAPRGISNGTLTHCWMNALMQMLITNPLMKRGILASESAELKPLADFIRGYDKAWKEGLSVVPQTYADSKALEAHFTTLLQTPGILAGRQNDLPEAWAAIHALLPDAFKQPMNQQVEYVAFTKPQTSHQIREKEIGPTCHLQVPLKINKTFDQLLDCHFNETKGEKTQYLDEDGLRFYKRSSVLRFHHAPPALWIELKRYDFSEGVARKITDDVQIPETYTLPLTNDRQAPYRLASCAVHKGTSDKEGHYTAFVKGQDGDWYEVSDTRVTKVEQSEFEKARQQAYLVQYARA